MSEKWSANYRSLSFLDRSPSFISAPLLQANVPPLIPFVPLLPDKLRLESNASSWVVFTMWLSFSPAGDTRNGNKDANNLPYLSPTLYLKIERRGRSQERDKDVNASGETTV